MESVMVINVLAGVYLLLSGVLAGVLVAVEIAVVPMLGALPGERFVQVHRLLDPNFDPVMPRMNKVALAVGAAILVFGSGGLPPKIAVATAEVCIIGVALVSELANVRINRRIHTWDVADLPADWRGIREHWFWANRARTALGVAAFTAAIAAGILT
jgi:anthrone oxygenase-like protein